MYALHRHIGISHHTQFKVKFKIYYHTRFHVPGCDYYKRVRVR